MVNAELSSSLSLKRVSRLENHQHQGSRAEDATAELASIFSLISDLECYVIWP